MKNNYIQAIHESIEDNRDKNKLELIKNFVFVFIDFIYGLILTLIKYDQIIRQYSKDEIYDYWKYLDNKKGFNHKQSVMLYWLEKYIYEREKMTLSDIGKRYLSIANCSNCSKYIPSIRENQYKKEYRNWQ